MKGYEKIETYDLDKIEVISDNYRLIIENIGEDIHREGILKTPERELLYSGRANNKA